MSPNVAQDVKAKMKETKGSIRDITKKVEQKADKTKQQIQKGTEDMKNAGMDAVDNMKEKANEVRHNLTNK